MEETKKKLNKKSILDWTVAAISVLLLIVCAFFWGCKYDLPATIIAVVLVIAGSVLLAKQTKALKAKNEIQ